MEFCEKANDGGFASVDSNRMSSRSFRLHNTLTGEIDELKLLEPGHLKFYSCGPTVYSYAHIGNFRTFLTGDLIVRTAEAIGWKVTYVSNITDVGHLTEDSFVDSHGEDKMARALKSKEGSQFNNVWELAEFYEDAFEEDWTRMNLRKPTVRPRATQHMREQILAAEDLIASKHAYETPSGVYFDVDSFKDYGKLSGNTQDSLRNAVRDVVLDESKRKQADFALWKKDDKHLMQWFSPYGWGFPGWHLECSVMARAYLGDTIDLHGGGEDLIFPHHECEIAQSETLTGKTFCNHWVHTRFLLVNGEKMAKSAGNYYTVRDLTSKGIDPLAIRYVLISGVFTKQLNFTDQALRDAVKIIDRYHDADATVASALKDALPGDNSLEDLGLLYEEALDAMLNNLNTSIALAKALEGVRLIQRNVPLNLASAGYASQFLDRINALLGIVRQESNLNALPQIENEQNEIDEKLIEERLNARKEAKSKRDFGVADSIRAELEAMGIDIQDTPQGTVWKRKSPV